MSNKDNLKRLNILLRTISKINQQLVISNDEKKLCQKICHHLVKIKGYKFVWMGLKESENDKLAPIAIAGKDKDFIKYIKNSWSKYGFNSCPTSMALKSGEHFVIEDLKNLESFVPWDKKAIEEGFLSTLVLPIKYHNDVVGTLHIYSDVKDYFLEEEVSFLKEVTGDISIGIKSIRDERKLIESKREYEELFKRMSSCVSIYEATDNGNDFIFKDFNIASEKTEKIKKEDVVGKSVLKVFPGVKDFGLLDVFKRVYKTGRPESFPISFYKDKRISGWRENFVYKLPSGDVVAVYNDLTEKKKAEEEIKSLAKFPEENPHLVGRVDCYGKLLYCNHTYKKVFKDIDYIPFKLKDAIKKIAAEKIFNPVDVEIEIGDRIFLFNLVPIKKESYFNFYGRDITESKETGKKLQENRALLNSVSEIAHIGGWTFDPKTLIQTWSDETFHILEIDLTKGEPKVPEGLNFIVPAFRPMAEQAVQNAIEFGEPYDQEWEVITAKGNRRWVRAVASVEKEQGKVIKILGSFQDITGRKKAEEALRESEEKYRTLVEKANEAITILQDGIFVFANHKTCELSGKQDGELEGKPFIDFVWPEDREMVASNHRKRMTEGGLLDNFDFRIIGVDGSPVWLSVSVTEIQYKGKPATLNLATDITERKKADKSLQESEKNLRMAQRLAKIGAWSWIAATDTVQWSEELCQINGHDLRLPAPSFFEEMSSFYTPESWERLNKAVTKALNNGESYELDLDLIRTDGSIIRTIARGEADYDTSGKIIGLQGTVQDITDRKKVEEEIVYLSFHDHLTGLYNRRFFEEELSRLDTKRQLPLSFIMGDINGLKLINDVFGHNEGDYLLVKVAEILKKVCRSDDILARWGGDEFVLLLPKTSISDSEEIVARIKKECKKTASQKIPLSLSLGASTKETQAQSIQAIIIDAESNMYRNKLAQKESISSSVIFALEQALYEKSNETKEHIDKVRDLSIKLGKSIKLHANQLDELSLLASLHDIGKVAIPETILAKEGKLTKKEWEVIKRHPEIGFNIASSSPQIAHIAKAILACHENFDGSGYPLGIAGESIPIISRIILISDAYDVMTRGRLYKDPMSKDDEIKELKRCTGTQFDPVLIDKFIEIISK